jgi:hypothetical protein
MAKKEKAQSIWGDLWAEYKIKWKKAWQEYKTLVGPFIKGTAKYIWLLIEELLAVVKTGLLETGKWLVEKILAWFKKV